MSKPVVKGTATGRVDQGVDFEQKAPYMAVASGRVIKVDKPGTWWNPNGTGEAVYIKLDKPITVNGRTYSEVYYAEQKPLVKVGQRIRVGQQVMSGGSVEVGFSKGGKPVAPLVGGTGAGTEATQAGYDFLDYMNKTAGTADRQAATVTATGNTNQSDTTGQLNPALVNQQLSAIQSIPQAGTGSATTAPPLAGDQADYTVTPEQSGPGTWQLIASQGQVSQDTIRLAQLASSASNATPGTG